MSKIHFFYQETKFKLNKKQKIQLQRWIIQIVQHFNFDLIELNYVFCSDGILSQYNIRYLQHNTLTDVITFDNSDYQRQIEGDILISIDRVRENAEKYGVSFDSELHRVMVHGLLHLLGFKDKTPEQKIIMRQQEDFCLLLWEQGKYT
ncbi:MAG: rRNA maturation RNase YbeY [Microscillaceae bacterium]|nr:rRNA maturation RNase YbeY [Microscillaceae bacterium]MDW8460010.1 rRNA maturation RNase YbeY [Cytophagales bacterium]